MTITTTTHLNFHGDARAALEFYQSVFGGDLTIATYGDFGMPAEAPGAANVVFGQVVSDAGFRVMAYDIPGEGDRAAEGAGSAESAGSAKSDAGSADPGTRPAAASTHRANGVTITDQPFFVSVRGETLAEVEGYWSALASGATIVEPLAASAWSPGFGMLTDRFGITWILDAAA
ncbi:VOC family protein [Marisediminicola senii]|uniref:VOC family protein n=1 Tax=Marisediminicola senii TaxID=2711233 RepID=UPI0013EAF048|nr:VOC family protein [Marisediminicola senii]